MFGIDWKTFRGKKYRETTREIVADNPSDDNPKHINFEILAYEIVKNITKRKWEHTQVSRDANHDAVLVMSIFGNGECETEWWMEAKFVYDNEKTKLTRYKIDSTIVSHYIFNQIYRSKGLNKSISKIYIVTNAKIISKVIKDISFAIKGANSTCETIFLQKEDVEYWLYRNQEIYKKYFANASTLEISNSENALYLPYEYEIYPYGQKYMNMFSFVEELKVNEKYIMYINIFSFVDSSLTITASEGIDIGNYQESIECGNNDISIPFIITPEYKEPIKFHFNNKEKLIDVKIRTADYHFKLEIESHKIIFKDLMEYLNYSSNEFQTYLILGNSASGKTTILNKIFNSLNVRYYFVTLKENQLTNLRELIDFIFHIFFPLENPDNINQEYLAKIIESDGLDFHFLQDLYEIKKSTVNNSDLNIIFQKINKLSIEFPRTKIILKGILFIDDIHRIGNIESIFLEKLFNICSESSFDIKIVAFGLTYFEDNILYKKFLNFNYRKDNDVLKCVITGNDFLNNFNIIFKKELKIDMSKILLLYNLIEIDEFFYFLKEKNIIIEDEESFLLEYSRFKSTDNAISIIKENFSKHLNIIDEESKILLRKIYLAKGKIKYDDETDTNETREEKRRLIYAKLVKRNILNYLEPYHDTYRNVYFKYFINDTNPFISLSYPDSLITSFTFSRNTNEKIEAAKEIISIRHSDCATTLYALEPIFANIKENKEKLIIELGKNLFYHLYQAYGVACANHSANISGHEIFKKIYEELKNEDDYELRKLSLVCLYEVMNSKFDALLIDEAKNLYTTFIFEYKNISSFINAENDIEWIKKEILAEEIIILIDSIRNTSDSNERFHKLRAKYLNPKILSYHHYLGFTARYAQILYSIDLDKAFYYTRQAYMMVNCPKIHTDNKHITEINFQYVYINMLKDMDSRHLETLKSMCENFRLTNFNKYRKAQCALVAVCIYFGDYNTAKSYILNEVNNIRPRRKRLEIFYQQNLALYALIVEKDKTKAINFFKNELDLIGNIPTYSNIVQHNIKILESGISYSLSFAKTPMLDKNVLYIDPRGDR